MTESERRKSERISFDDPLRGKVGGVSVSVLDIGLNGSKVEHQAALPIGSTVEFSFTWEGHSLQFSAKTVRCVLQGFSGGKKIFHSGLDFLESHGDSESVLRRLVTGESPTEASTVAPVVPVASVAPVVLITPVTTVVPVAPVTPLTPLAPTAPVAPAAPDPKWQPAPFFSFADEELLQFVEAAEEAEASRGKSGSPFIECRLHENGTWTRTPVFDSASPPSGFTIARPDNEKELDLLCRTYESADNQTRLKIRASLESRARRSP